MRPIDATEIPWKDDIVQLDDVVRAYRQLQDREEEYDNCRFCNLTVANIGPRLVHVDDGYADCEGSDTKAKRGDALDDDERDALELLRQLDKALNYNMDGYAENSSCLIADKYFEDYAEDYAKGIHEIPDWLDGYVDWEKYAEDFKADYSEIELTSGYWGNLVFWVREY